jgi:hypothetical protein
VRPYRRPGPYQRTEVLLLGGLLPWWSPCGSSCSLWPRLTLASTIGRPTGQARAVRGCSWGSSLAAGRRAPQATILCPPARAQTSGSHRVRYRRRETGQQLTHPQFRVHRPSDRGRSKSTPLRGHFCSFEQWSRPHGRPMLAMSERPNTFFSIRPLRAQHFPVAWGRRGEGAGCSCVKLLILHAWQPCPLCFFTQSRACCEPILSHVVHGWS